MIHRYFKLQKNILNKYFIFKIKINFKDAVVAQQFMQDRGMWKRTSLFWAQHFANAPGKKDEDFEKAFLKVIEMGVDSKKALDALRHGDH